MSERLVRKVVLAALKGEIGDGGWLKIDAPKVTEKEISLAVMEAAERGLVKACDVSNPDSHHPEWRLTGPTGASAKFVRETRVSKKVWAAAVAIVAGVVAFLSVVDSDCCGPHKKVIFRLAKWGSYGCNSPLETLC